MVNASLESQQFMNLIEREGYMAQLRSLHDKRPLISLWWIFRNLLLIALAILLFQVSIWLLPLSVILIGRCIRSLGNQCHEVSHQNIFKSKRLNKRLSRFFLMPLMFYDYGHYLKEHILHHKYLGQDGIDPDIIRLDLRRRRSENHLIQYLLLLKPLLLNWSFIQSSLFGDFQIINAQKRLYIISWWSIVCLTIGFLRGFPLLLDCILLWFLARITTYHFIRVQAEVCDHIPWNNTSIVMHSRNMPRNWLSFFFHPENDNFHMTHHLFPGIPMPNLLRAHQLLMNFDEYLAGEHLQSYFGNQDSVISSILYEKC